MRLNITPGFQLPKQLISIVIIGENFEHLQLDQDAFFYSLKKMQTKHSAMKG